MKGWIDLPPVWLAGFLALTVALDAIVPWKLFGPNAGVVGLALVGTGLAVMAAAVAQMAVRRTTVIPRRDPARLVTGGIFRISRNPIYLGDALVLAGAILWWDVPLAAPLLPVFMLVIQHRFILGEEARLREGFGADYAAWSARTRRWL